MWINWPFKLSAAFSVEVIAGIASTQSATVTLLPSVALYVKAIPTTTKRPSFLTTLWRKLWNTQAHHTLLSLGYQMHFGAWVTSWPYFALWAYCGKRVKMHASSYSRDFAGMVHPILFFSWNYKGFFVRLHLNTIDLLNVESLQITWSLWTLLCMPYEG